jgi:hypothetical protein
METFEDPGYQHTASMAKILSLYVINLTRSDVIPFRFSEMAAHISSRMNQFEIDHPEIEIFSSVGRHAAEMKQIVLKLEQHRQKPNLKSADKINSLR